MSRRTKLRYRASGDDGARQIRRDDQVLAHRHARYERFDHAAVEAAVGCGNIE